jgi:hypothetical protein
MALKGLAAQKSSKLLSNIELRIIIIETLILSLYIALAVYSYLQQSL